MIRFAWFCLLLSATSVDLVDEVYKIPANEWRYVEVGLKQQPATLSAEVEGREGSRDIRVALLRRDDLDRLRSDRPHGVLAATSPGESGRLRYYLHDPGEYAVVVDNRGGDVPATVRLRVWLDFAGTQGPNVTQLPRQRQLVVILISFAVFFGIATWSARRLLRAVKR